MSITSAPDEPSGLVSHAESAIDQWIATLPCHDEIAPMHPAVVEQRLEPPTAAGGDGDGGGGEGEGGAGRGGEGDAVDAVPMHM